MTPERWAENEILAYLTSLKIRCWKNESQGTFDAKRGVFRSNKNPYKMKGVSDILGILPDGRMLAIEVKRPKRVSLAGKVLDYGGKPTLEQIAFIQMINQSKGIAFIASSCEEARDQLKARGIL